jgi:hypothetical protein
MPGRPVETYVNPHMGTISLCVRGLPICKFFWIPAHSMGTPSMRKGISFWIVSDLSSSHALNQNFHMRRTMNQNFANAQHAHTTSKTDRMTWNTHTYGDQDQSPYAYGYHTGITWHVIPVCIQGFVWSPFAYRDISVTNRMHTGIIPIWEIKSCIPMRKLRGSPYAYGDGSLKSSHMGIPVRIMKLCAYRD